MAAEWVPRSEYGRKLQDPRWQKKRLEILERDRFQCQVCGDCRSMLHVHHVAYCPREVEDRSPWDYHDSGLVTLCVSCHENEGQFDRVGGFLARALLARIGVRTVFDIEFLASQFAERINRLSAASPASILADLVVAFDGVRAAGIAEQVWYRDE